MSTLIADFHQSNQHRRSMMPTPEGAIPKPRRARRGMVDLAEWDRRVAADNAANGTTSERPATDGPAAPPAMPPQTMPPAPPDDGDGTGTIDGNTATTRNALLECDTPPAPPIELPPPTGAGIAAAKAMLKQPEPEPFVPPPPAAKQPKQPKPHETK